MTIEDLNTAAELLTNDLSLEFNTKHPEAVLSPEMLELITRIISMALTVGYETGIGQVTRKLGEFFASGPNMTGTTLMRYMTEMFSGELV